MKMNKNIWNGFNKWAMIVNDQSRIEDVWNNGLAVDLQASEQFTIGITIVCGKTMVILCGVMILSFIQVTAHWNIRLMQCIKSCLKFLKS